jgi:hypothetical protein
MPWLRLRCPFRPPKHTLVHELHFHRGAPNPPQTPGLKSADVDRVSTMLRLRWAIVASMDDHRNAAQASGHFNRTLSTLNAECLATTTRLLGHHSAALLTRGNCLASHLHGQACMAVVRRTFRTAGISKWLLHTSGHIRDPFLQH